MKGFHVMPNQYKKQQSAFFLKKIEGIVTYPKGIVTYPKGIVTYPKVS